MFKRLLVIPIISVFVLAFYYSGDVFALDTGTVTATVTVQEISLTVSDGTVAYGILALSATNNTSTLTQTQIVENTGNVTIDVNIKGQDTVSWTLASTIGADQYIHQFCLATCGTYPTNYTPMTTGYTLAINDLTTASPTQNLDLGISTPSTSTDFTQQSVDVMVQAVAA